MDATKNGFEICHANFFNNQFPGTTYTTFCFCRNTNVFVKRESRRLSHVFSSDDYVPRWKFLPGLSDGHDMVSIMIDCTT